MTLANDHLLPLWYPHPSLREAAKGSVSTQPWVSALLYQLVRALGIKDVLEVGCYEGVTSAWLACALQANGGGVLTVVDRVPEMVGRTRRRLEAMALPGVVLIYETADAAEFLQTKPLEHYQFVFLDDDKETVGDKVAKLAPGTYVAIHDADILGGKLPPGGVVLESPPCYSSGHLWLGRKA